jgi:uncharacterized protein YjbJ (UPF0337 family)
MNWDRIEGSWRQLKGKAIQQWGKLTDDQFDRIAGKREQLIGEVQESLRHQQRRSRQTGEGLGVAALSRDVRRRLT